jgi:hypothetical protein
VHSADKASHCILWQSEKFTRSSSIIAKQAMKVHLELRGNKLITDT